MRNLSANHADSREKETCEITNFCDEVMTEISIKEKSRNGSSSFDDSDFFCHSSLGLRYSHP